MMATGANTLAAIRCASSTEFVADDEEKEVEEEEERKEELDDKKFLLTILSTVSYMHSNS